MTYLSDKVKYGHYRGIEYDKAEITALSWAIGILERLYPEAEAGASNDHATSPEKDYRYRDIEFLDIEPCDEPTGS